MNQNIVLQQPFLLSFGFGFGKSMLKQIELQEELISINRQAILMLSLEDWLNFVQYREIMLRCGYGLERVVGKLKSYLFGG